MNFYANRGFHEREITRTTTIKGKRWRYGRSYTSKKDAEKDLKWNKKIPACKRRLSIKEVKGFTLLNKTRERKLYRIWIGPLDKRKTKKK